MSWREQIRNGYPWKPLVFVGLMAILIVAALYGVFVANPQERAAIDHGTRTIGHARTWKNYNGHGHGVYRWAANVTWTDADGHGHEKKDLDISDGEAAAIGSASDVEIQYIGDTVVITADIQHRVRDESNGPWVLGIFVICALMGVYHWRRRVREWRAPKPVQW